MEINIDEIECPVHKTKMNVIEREYPNSKFEEVAPLGVALQKTKVTDEYKLTFGCRYGCKLVAQMKDVIYLKDYYNEKI